MNIRKLQQQAASSVDELLSISGDMDAYVIAAYGSAPQEVVAMQCRIQLERLKRLGKRLLEIRMEISGRTSTTEGISQEQRRSIAVTEQLIAQNLLIIAQKEELLEGFLAHSDRIEIQQRHAKELHDMAEVIRLKETLRNSL